MKTAFIFLGLFICSGLLAAQDLVIKERLLPDNCYGERKGTKVEYLVLHFCSDAVQNPENPYSVDRIYEIFSEYHVSAHYLIDRDGTVYRMVPEKKAAWHAGKGKLPHPPHHQNNINRRAIGIEMLAVGSENDMEMFMKPAAYRKIAPALRGFTEAQYASLNRLKEQILARNPGIKKNRKHIVGHEEINSARRSDPGELFDWKRIGLE